MHMKFSTISVDFRSLIADSLRSRRSAHAGVKKGYTPKSGYSILPLLARVWRENVCRYTQTCCLSKRKKLVTSFLWVSTSTTLTDLKPCYFALCIHSRRGRTDAGASRERCWMLRSFVKTTHIVKGANRAIAINSQPIYGASPVTE